MSENSALQSNHTTGDARERARIGVAAVLFAALASLAAVDLVSDIGEGASVSHWVVEGTLLVVSLIGLAVLGRVLLGLFRRTDQLEQRTRSLSARLKDKAEESSELRDDLLEAAAEARRWQEEARELVNGLSQAIDKQFDRWSLSDAEKEVALLLLKGLTHKEVAEVRGTSDATSRQQARAVYKKAGLSGRNDLAAFFLEDLLVPTHHERAFGSALSIEES
jgi:DNA-binding CsgD family transcriptional regulator